MVVVVEVLDAACKLVNGTDVASVAPCCRDEGPLIARRYLSIA